MYNNINVLFDKLNKSKFRSSFHLRKYMIDYVHEKGLDVIKKHAYDFINKRLKNAYPKNDDEIVISSNIQSILSVDIGDSITIDSPIGQFDYIINGICYTSDAIANMTQYDAIGAIMNMESFGRFMDFDSKNDDFVYFVQFKDHVNIQKAIKEIKAEYNLTDDDIAENTGLLALAGMSSSDYMQNLYGVAAILFVLILAAGVLMIAGSINASVAERTQFFGMLRCVGASKKQIGQNVGILLLAVSGTGKNWILEIIAQKLLYQTEKFLVYLLSFA